MPADTVSGDEPGDDEPTDPPQEGEKEPKSRSARVRARMRQERDQAVAAAQMLYQQLSTAQQQAMQNAQRAAHMEREAVESRFQYLESIRHQMEVAKKSAMDEGRSDVIATIDSNMMQLGPELHQIRQRRAMMQQQRPHQPQQMAPQQPQMPQQPRPTVRLHEAAQKWADAQTQWLNADPSRVADARSIAQRLEAQGIQPDEPEYYDRLNTALTGIHSDYRPVNPLKATQTRSTGSAVAGVNRASSVPSRQTKQVVLTSEDMAFCETHGINPKSYAREKLAAQGG